MTSLLVEFPKLSDAQFDLLCAAQDAGGRVTRSDLIEYSELPSDLTTEVAIESLIEMSFLSRRRVSSVEFVEITPLGDRHLKSVPPAGAEI